jgi:hypothetical protein
MMTRDELSEWHRWCDEQYAHDLLDETLAEIATVPVDVQQVLRRLLHHHLDTDFTADIDIDNHSRDSIELFHRYAESEPKSLTN